MKSSKITKITSALLATAIIGTTFFAYFRVPAGASTSLNNIENIKAAKQNSGAPFKIVEIAPSNEYGTMGYYVPGQEGPVVQNWLSTISNMDDASERISYANNVILAPLEEKKLLSATDQTPLTKTGVYDEHYPWETDFISEEYYKSENATRMQLSQNEKFATKGTPVPYTSEDQENGVSKVGYYFDMGHNYTLALEDNLFNFKDWYHKAKDNWNNDDEFHQMTHTGSSSFTPTEETIEESDALTIKLTHEDESYIKTKGEADNAAIPVENGVTYVVYAYTEVNPDIKTENGENTEYYDLTAKLGLYGYSEQVNTETGESTVSFGNIGAIESESTGWNSYTFTSQGDKIVLEFGAKGRGSVSFSKIQIYKYSGATHVQNVTQFGYGESPETYGDNLFNPTAWYANARSKELSNKTAGDTLAFDSEEKIITVTSDGTGSNDIYTGYGTRDAYFMNADPGATYEVTYDVKVTGGSAQFHIFPVKSGLSSYATLTGLENSVSPSGLRKNSNGWFAHSYSGTVSERLLFKVDNETMFLKLRFGVSTANTTAVYSNIRVRKLSSEPVYYYDVEPTGLYYQYSNSNRNLPPEGTILYTLEGDKYVYAGVYSPTERFGFHMITGKDFYSLDVKAGTFPSKVRDADHPYYAIADGFVVASGKPAYFVEGDGELTYVGMDENGIGNGSYKITAGTRDLIINSTSVFYTGGFVNNNWFKYKVLDADDKTVDSNGNTVDTYTFPIVVEVYSPSDPGLADELRYADLIVISAGLDLYAGANAAWTRGFTSDFPDANTIPDIIRSRITAKDAVVVDLAVLSTAGSNPNLLALASELTSERTVSGGVKGSIYVYSSAAISQSDSPVKSMANRNFCTAPGKINSASTEGSPYYLVYEEIQNENDVRRNLSPGNPNYLVNSDVNQATCIRYVLNYKNQRIYKVLDKVTVLDIEPASSNPSLTLEKLNAMMPTGLQYSKDDVEIIGMSVSEFVAKNEDFAENYDLVYIGASTDNMSRVLKKGDTFNYITTDGVEGTATITNSGKPDEAYLALAEAGKVPYLHEGDPVYNDPKMNGMYYTNVGDKIETANKEAIDNDKLKKWTYWINPANWGKMADDLSSPPSLGGMLKEDYFNLGDELGFGLLKTIYIPLGGHATMRSSGNDLNQAAMERLQNYADTGRPLIIDDKLVSVGIHDYLTAYNYAEELVPDYSNGGYSAKFHCYVIQGDVNYSTVNDDIKNNRLDIINDKPDISLRYQWYYDDGTGAKPIAGATDKDYTANVTTSKMEVVKDANGNIQYDTIKRTRKILWWTRYEEVKVAKYKAVPQGIGEYYCVVDFSYHGFSASNNATNKVKVEMGGTDYFVARLFSNAYFDGSIKSSNFTNATYWVEFHEIDPSQLSGTVGNTDTPFNYGRNITDYVMNKYQVKFEYWDEQHDWGLLCQRHNWAHATCGKITRVLKSYSDYENFNDANYGTGPFYATCNDRHRDWPWQSWEYCKDYGPYRYDANTSKDYLDYNPSSYGEHGLGVGLDNKKLTATDSATVTYANYVASSDKNKAGVVTKNWNRAILRMKFTVGGDQITLQSAKSGGPLTTVFVSRSTGPVTEDEKHDDFSTYNFAELYGAYHFKGLNATTPTDSYEVGKNGGNSGGTNMPEYIYQIADVNQVPVQSEPVKWRVDTDSEASSSNIDNCSYMWRLIVGEYYDHDTVFCYDDAISDRDNNTSKLAKALKTPRPVIKMVTHAEDSTVAPEYSIGADSESLVRGDSAIELRLKFYIEETSGYFEDSKYHAYLYIDQDGDGKFANGEMWQDGGKSNLRVKTSSNSAPNEYTVTLNPSFKGVIPWKLYIVEESGSDGLTSDGRIPQHMTQTGYAYVKPDANDPIAINALMVLPGAWNPAEWTEYGKAYLNVANEVIGNNLNVYGQKKKIDANYWAGGGNGNTYIGTVFASDVFDHLEGPNTRRMTREEFEELGVTTKTWDGIGGVDDNEGYYHLGFVVNEGDIKIMITCISIHLLNEFYGLQSGDGFGGDKWRCPEEDCENHNKDIQGMYCTECGAIKTENKNGDKDLLQQYNMLILGFGDSWGKLPATFLDILGMQVLYQEGLSNYSALAIRNYIDSDKNVLFCHDTTNKTVDFLDLYADKLKRIGANIWSGIGQGVNWILNGIQSIFGVGPDWRMDTVSEKLKDTKIKDGYWNNIVLREALGLDRYGLTEAIITRSEAIVNGDVDNENYASILKDPFANAPLGRAHMHNYIYNGYETIDQNADFTARDLTVKHMLETNHSIAWVPGTAQVYGRNTENPALNYTVDSNGVKHYEGEPILDSSGNIHADYDRYTQGFTDYTIARYINPNDAEQLFPSAGTERFDRSQLKDDDKYQAPFYTSTVTQVNGGKITSYPYNINVTNDHDGKIDGFLHSVDDMNTPISVKLTHEQVYQCNMNGDDITVWYALSDGDFWSYNESTGKYTGIRNDAANAYYMYSRGNVTYTGAGHTNEFNEFEAKLFINTLVAAYRDTFTVPSVAFRDKEDTKSNKYLLLSPDIDPVTDAEILVPEDDIYLKIYDNNVGSSKTQITYSTKFYYIDDNGNKVDITDKVTLRTENGVPSTVPKMKLLHFAVPDVVKDEFYLKDSSGNFVLDGEGNRQLGKKMSVRVYCVPSVTIKKVNEPAETKEGIPNWIEVRRLDLSNLG